MKIIKRERMKVKRMEMGGGDMMWSDSAGFSVSSNLCWAWGCQRVGECLCIDE